MAHVEPGDAREKQRDQELTEAQKLRAAIRAAGFSVMQTSGAWSIHDTSERGKAEEAKALEVATRNVELEVENAKLRAALKAAEWIMRSHIMPEHFDGHAAQALAQVRAALAESTVPA